MPLIDRDTAKLESLEVDLKAFRYKNDKRYEALEKRISGMWWKMGILAGILSIVVGQVFGTGVMAALSPLIGC